MKFFVMMLLAAIALPAAAEWDTNLEKAISQAKHENKLVLIFFSGSDWSGNSIRMKNDILDTSDFEDFADDNLVLVNIDFQRLFRNHISSPQDEYNQKIASKYDVMHRLPVLILLDHKGNKIGEWTYSYRLTTSMLIQSISSCYNSQR